MYWTYPSVRRTGAILSFVLILLSQLTSPTLAGGPTPMKAGDQPAADKAGPPILTFKPVLAPRRDPAPIPHTDLVDPGAADLRPHNLAAAQAAAQQGATGKPGVLQTVTEVASGLTLFEPEERICNDFNSRTVWEGETWTNYFDGWGAYAADDGFYQAKNVTFDRELVVGPGANYARNESSMKIASNQPYEAGVMSPPIEVEPGDRVRVRVFYLIYNHDTTGRNWDYVSMGIIPKLGERASYVYGYHRGEWAVLEQEIEAQGDQVVVMLQGHSPAAINSNVYFDNVSIWINDSVVRNCRG